MTIVVTSLNSRLPVGLKVTAEFSTHAICSEHCFDAGSNALQLEAVD